MPSRYDVRHLLAAVCLLWSAATTAEDEPAFFLIAAPKITDPNFRETVVLIVQHTPLASHGVIINRPLDTPLAHVLPDNEAPAHANEPVYFGGPVALRTLSVAFRARERPKGSVHVIEDVYIADNPWLLQDLLKRDASAHVRVYAGHASWGPGQLESEIEEGGWFATHATPDFVFHGNPEGIWSELLRRASQRSAKVGAADDAPAW
ncbi:MAG TPA: YqgE/AlgH family protein [Burkholderiales bacterium]|nr:YqgE/AlgH family protein [Burkholderiales bacterium]